MPADRKLSIAEHLLTKSYPALEDPKILLSVLHNILGAVEDAVTDALAQARENNDIPAHGTTFNQKLNAFRMHLAKQKGVTKVDLMMISEMQELLAEHAQAPTTFRRDESFVIADNDFNLKTLTPKKARTYLTRTKRFVEKL